MTPLKDTDCPLTSYCLVQGGPMPRLFSLKFPQMSLASTYLDSVVKRLLTYKELGEKTFAQLEEKDFFMQPNETCNSIAQIIRHMGGNMLSRWTNFLTEDGEKPWRNRDQEFEAHEYTREQLLEQWEKGWACFINALQELREDDLLKTIYIRKEGLTALDAITRQIAHYSYHVGQIVFIGKLLKDADWKTLSIPKADSNRLTSK